MRVGAALGFAVGIAVGLTVGVFVPPLDGEPVEPAPAVGALVLLKGAPLGAGEGARVETG